MRSSDPGGVKSTRRVSELPMRSSIQRCLSSKGWSVTTLKPSLAVKNSSARSWSLTGTLANLRWVIIGGLPRGVEVGASCHGRGAASLIKAIVLETMTGFALDPYVLDVLLPELVGHDHSPSAFIVYVY